ncbi:MAG: choice-of-anchor B family protein [Bacteroidetes bacterium]|nr:choice-of-anchor B family protein [Bacteroidota bacterium]
MKSLYLMAVLFLAAEVLHAQGGSNVQFIGQMRTRGTSGYSQCWGYNAPNGKEYAIIGCFTGTQIVDITSDTLKEVAFIPGPNSGWREMKVYQKYAYVVTEGSGAGLQIIDLDSMKLVNTITTAQVPTGHTISIEGKYLYISGSQYKSGGIVILDLTDPVHPVYVGEYQAQYVHDCVIKNDTIYAAAIYGQGIDIISAVNKAKPTRVSITNYPYSGTHNTDVTDDKRYVFTTDEINSGPNGNILRIWDRSDITDLKLVGTYVARPNTIVHNIHLKGKYGYLAHYSEGVRILDIKYPAIPVEVAHYDTYIGSVNNYVGAWGTFPYFNSNKVIISDMSGGLFVIRFAGQNGTVRAARTVLTVRDSVTNAPISGVAVTVPGYYEPFITDQDGKVQFGAVTDTVTIALHKSTFNSGYRSVTKKITMIYDSLVQQEVVMKPVQTGSLTVNAVTKQSGTPVKYLSVKIDDTPVSGTTDSTGAFFVPALLASGTYTVRAAQWGFAPESLSVTINAGVNNPVQLQLTPQRTDNFESDLGWSVGSPSDSGTTGIWKRSAAVAAVFGKDTLQPATDHSAVGTRLYVTGATPVTSDYVEYRTTLTSPVVSLAGMTEPSFTFWNFFNSLSAAKDDTMFVELSNDGGNSWKRALGIAGKLPFWKQYRIGVKDVLAATDRMRIRFVAFDGGVTSIFDSAVDDVEFGDGLQLSVERDGSAVPSAYQLEQNYPNPFNPSTTIRYHVPVSGPVRVSVFDLLGREVAVLAKGMHEAGIHTVQFNGAGHSSGVYLYRMQAGNFTRTHKLTLMK